jgi:cytochrome c oxidase cbb3-type subunit 3
MADFNSEFWHWYISILTVLSIAACFGLVIWMSRGKLPPTQTEDTGHIWDVDLSELNNPLPRWWLGLFYITLVFGGFYLLLYPGLGHYQGLLNWSSNQEYKDEIKAADEKFGPLFAKFESQNIEQLAKDPKAVEIGERLFLNYCSTCHGSDARGARGFPNLRDNDWLWGNSPEQIKHSITHGRQAMMPAWEAPLGGVAGVSDVVDYILSLNGLDHDSEAASRGGQKYAIFCIACHGAEGKGNALFGAPNITDDIWLYGASRKKITESIGKGRSGQMPAHGEFLGTAKTHLLSAYIYGLSNP